MTETSVQIDTDKLMAFVFRAVDEVGAALNCALVVMGDQLGYYRDLAANGPTTPDELAEALTRFVVDYGAGLVGGCCGTTPVHIRRVKWRAAPADSCSAPG